MRFRLSSFRCRVAIGLVLHSLLLNSTEAADIFVSNDAELATALDDAVSGDRILLAPGRYGRFSRTGLSGITLSSQDLNDRAIIDASGGSEAMKLSSVTDVTVEHLVFENYTANGVNIDDSGDWPGGKSTGVVLRRVTVRNDVAVGGNRDGIKLSGVDGFHLDGVEVLNWGTGGSAVDPVGSHNGVIENSRFVHEGTAASGVRPKGGSSNIQIRGNFFELSSGRAIQFGGTTGSEFFRFLPGESGYEADAISAAGNIIKGAESAFSWVNIDGGVARHNFIDTPERWIMRILNENQGLDIIDTQNGIFADNLIRFDEDLSRVANIGPEVLSDTFQFARNQWFDVDNPSLTESDLYLPAPEVDGVYGVELGIDPDQAVAFEMDWGRWIVNPHDRVAMLSIDDFEGLSIAVANVGATFNPLAEDPFQGDWTFTPLTAGNLQIGERRSLILAVTAIPEPSACAACLMSFVVITLRSRRR